MHRFILGLMVALVVLAIGAFMTTYTVRFTETAVVTRAGKKVAEVDEAGLKFKIPLIDRVTKYDKRLRLLSSRSVTQQTSDDSQIIVEAFATWRVKEPYTFYQRFRNNGEQSSEHFAAADDLLKSTLMSAMSEVSRFRIDELFSPQPGATKLPELEERILAAVLSTGSGDQSVSAYGIEITSVGISRVLLPEETTNKVIERMGASRDRLAQELQSQGDAEAAAIRAQAEADVEKIRTFAQRRASEIIARGEREAAEYLAAQNVNPDLATFLQNIEFMKQAMAKRFTLVLPSTNFGMQMFAPGAAAAGGVGFPVTAPIGDPTGVDVLSTGGPGQ